MGRVLFPVERCAMPGTGGFSYAYSRHVADAGGDDGDRVLMDAHTPMGALHFS